MTSCGARDVDRRGGRRSRSSPTGSSRRPGAGLGLLCFGPLAERFGRAARVRIMHASPRCRAGVCYGPRTYAQMLAMLPVFGFFTVGIHAGYAVYFPELFPDHLRATGHGGLLQRRPAAGGAALVGLGGGQGEAVRPAARR